MSGYISHKPLSFCVTISLVTVIYFVCLKSVNIYSYMTEPKSYAINIQKTQKYSVHRDTYVTGDTGTGNPNTAHNPVFNEVESDNSNTEHHDGASYKLFEFEDTQYSADKVRHAKLEFLPQFKNPCWVERYTGENVYNRNTYIVNRTYAEKWGFHTKMESLDPKGVSVQLENGICAIEKNCRLRCLPYFMLIGVAKSGTSDVDHRIMNHPEIFQANNKELYWWTQYRYSLKVTLGDYSDLFDISLNNILEKKGSDGKYSNILGEFTSMTFFDFAHWREDEFNKNLLEPRKTVAHDIKAVIPNVKMIVIMRNPTSRLYSNYNMFNHQEGTPEDFHERVSGSIVWWETCVSQLPVRNCAYGSPPGMPPVYDMLGDRTQWWHRDRNYTGEIRYGMYGLMIKEWLAVFPKESFLFLKTEEYSLDIGKAYNEQIFPFLGVKTLPEGPEFETIKNSKPAHTGRYQPILEKTQLILDEFYRPFNEELAKVLNDDKWLWRD